MIKKNLLFGVVAILTLLSSCGEETIDINPKNLLPCDDTSAVTYNNDIKKLIQVNCINNGCHCPTCTETFPPGVYLDTYSGVKQQVSNGNLLSRIGPTASVRMPYGLPPLSNCDIKKIERWVKNGAPE